MCQVGILSCNHIPAVPALFNFLYVVCAGLLLPVLQLDWPTINLNSSGIFSISTFALSLLLVFRTNSSYER